MVKISVLLVSITLNIYCCMTCPNCEMKEDAVSEYYVLVLMPEKLHVNPEM